MMGWTVIHRGPIVFLLTRPQTLHSSSGLRSTYCVPSTGWNYPTLHPPPRVQLLPTVSPPAGITLDLHPPPRIHKHLLCAQHQLELPLPLYQSPRTQKHLLCAQHWLELPPTLHPSPGLRATHCVPSSDWNYPQLCTPPPQDSEATHCVPGTGWNYPWQASLLGLKL